MVNIHNLKVILHMVNIHNLKDHTLHKGNILHLKVILHKGNIHHLKATHHKGNILLKVINQSKKIYRNNLKSIFGYLYIYLSKNKNINNQMSLKN